MIYLENITTEQGVLIPANGLTKGATSMLFSIRSTISGEVVYEDSITTQETEGYYYINLTLPAGLNDGEYKYSLSYEIETYASGLCQIGGIRKAVTQGDGGFTLKQAK